jgi:hypothetical protein
MSTDNLILQRDIMNLLSDYADKYPLASCDKTTRRIGALLRQIMLDVLMEVPITASIYTDTHKSNADQHIQGVESVGSVQQAEREGE